MNDLLNKLGKIKNVKALAYADDLVLVIQDARRYVINSKVNEAIDVIGEGCGSTCLNINAKKTQMMEVGTREADLEIIIDGDRVEKEKSIKYLGIMLSKEMKWRENLVYLKEKTMKFTNVFNRLYFMNKKMTLKKRLVIYRQVFMPIISYGNQVWFKDIKFKYQKNQLIKLQRAALLSIYYKML